MLHENIINPAIWDEDKTDNKQSNEYYDFHLTPHLLKSGTPRTSIRPYAINPFPPGTVTFFRLSNELRRIWKSAAM
jgi:hypothetical protein